MKNEWSRYQAGETIPLPAWFWAWSESEDVYGLVAAESGGTIPSRWTHWMPWIGDDIPNPPDCGVMTLDPGSSLPEPTIGTPLRIQILLHAYVSPEPMPYRGSAGTSELEDLVRAGAIEERGPDHKAVYRTTKLGVAWVMALLNVPIPRVVYLDSQGQELEVRLK